MPLNYIQEIDIPTVAAIDGVALGGGLEMALCCDLRISGPLAKMGLPEAKLAIIPGYIIHVKGNLSMERAGGTQRLSRIVGSAQAKYLMFTGKLLTSQEAFSIGLVQDTDPESAFQKSVNIALQIAENGPVAIRLIKRAVDRSDNIPL